MTSILSINFCNLFYDDQRLLKVLVMYLHGRKLFYYWKNNIPKSCTLLFVKILSFETYLMAKKYSEFHNLRAYFNNLW